MSCANYLAKNLKFLRATNNVKQETLASYLNCSVPTISSWENEKAPKQPSIETVIKIADYYKITIDELITVDLVKRKDEVISKPVQGIYRKIDYFEYKYSIPKSISIIGIILMGVLLIISFLGKTTPVLIGVLVITSIVYSFAICVRIYAFFFSNKSVLLNASNDILFKNELDEAYLLRIKTFYNIILALHMLLSTVIFVISTAYIIIIDDGNHWLVIAAIPFINISLGAIFLYNSKKYYMKEVSFLDKKRFIPIFFLEVTSIISLFINMIMVIDGHRAEFDGMKFTYLLLSTLAFTVIILLRSVCLYIYSKYKPFMTRAKKQGEL